MPRHISENIDIALGFDFGRGGATPPPDVCGGQRISDVGSFRFPTMLLCVLGPQNLQQALLPAEPSFWLSILIFLTVVSCVCGCVCVTKTCKIVKIYL